MYKDNRLHRGHKPWIELFHPVLVETSSDLQQNICVRFSVEACNQKCLFVCVHGCRVCQSPLCIYTKQNLHKTPMLSCATKHLPNTHTHAHTHKHTHRHTHTGKNTWILNMSARHKLLWATNRVPQSIMQAACGRIKAYDLCANMLI